MGPMVHDMPVDEIQVDMEWVGPLLHGGINYPTPRHRPRKPDRPWPISWWRFERYPWVNATVVGMSPRMESPGPSWHLRACMKDLAQQPGKVWLGSGQPDRPQDVSKDQHGVTEGVEAVALAFGDLVGVEDRFSAGEGAHQHQQSRAGQVEIGDQRIDGLELETREDV